MGLVIKIRALLLKALFIARPIIGKVVIFSSSSSRFFFQSQSQSSKHARNSFSKSLKERKKR